MAKLEVLEITAFHRDAFAILGRAHTQTQTTAQKMAQLLATKYGKPVTVKDKDGKDTLSGGPSFEAYRADQAALREIAKDRKLKDAQWLRKSYAKAVRETYGKLPESQSAEAIQKRQQREAAAKQAEGNPPAPTVGAPAGQTQEHAPSPSETIEALVTRLGLFNTGFAIVRILEADESTKGQAVHIRKMLEKAQDAHVKAHSPELMEPKTRKIERKAA